MPIDLHLICPRGHMLQPVASGLLVPVGDGFTNDMFETGGWEDISPEEANEAVGGRLYLHVAQSKEPWHGGTIIDWRVATPAQTPRSLQPFPSPRSLQPVHTGRALQYPRAEKAKVFRFWADAPLVICCKWRGRVGFNRREATS